MYRTKALVLAAIFTLATQMIPSSAHAQTEQTPQTPEQVAYIKLIEGDVGYLRGDDNQGQWNGAATNTPLMTGDSLYANENSRAEIQLSETSFLRLGKLAYVGVLQNSGEIFQLKLTSGTATLRIQQLDRTYEIDTPSLAFTPRQPGEYRFDVNESGDTEITLHEGEGVANIAQRGEESLVAPIRLKVLSANSQTNLSGSSNRDSWDQWNVERDNLAFHSSSRQYVPPGVYGYDTLDTYGRWVTAPGYGSVWMPNGVESGWQPYRVGRWIWVDPYGWTWVSYEPWGWAPYHYGRWAYVGDYGWCWVPGAPTVRQRFSAALVAFMTGSDWFGWFPLGPGEEYVPVYAVTPVYVARPVVQYVNYTHVTVINRTEIYNTTYVYNTRVIDRRIIERTRVVPNCTLQPSRDVLYVRRDIRNAGTPGQGATVKPAAYRPPDQLRDRPIHAINKEVPAVKKFDEKLAEIQRTGAVRPVNPVRADQKFNVVTANPRPQTESGSKTTAPGVTASPSDPRGKSVGSQTNAASVTSQSTEPRRFKVPSPNAKPQPASSSVTPTPNSPAAPPQSGKKTWTVPSQSPASPSGGGRADQTPNVGAGQSPHSTTPSYIPPSAGAPGTGVGPQPASPTGQPRYTPPQSRIPANPAQTPQGAPRTQGQAPPTYRPPGQQPQPQRTPQQTQAPRPQPAPQVQPPRTQPAPQVQQPRPQPAPQPAQQPKPQQQQQQQQQQQDKPKPKPPQH